MENKDKILSMIFSFCQILMTHITHKKLQIDFEIF